MEYLLEKVEDKAFDSFKVYKAEVENQLGKRIKILRSDHGGEYFIGMFDAFCEENESRDVDFFEDKFSNDVENSHAKLVPTPCSSSMEKPPQRLINHDKAYELESRRILELAELPKGVRPIGSKWVLKKKLNLDGLICAFKARLLAKGYRQKEGIDYFDTYASVARISSIRTLIAISAVKGLYIHQMDVKTAFLNGYLNEEVYMEQPEGFVIQGHENKVCRLASTTVLIGVFILEARKKYTVVICIYVNDMLIIGTTLDGILKTKLYLSSNFKMKDLGEFRHLDIKECNTPFDTSVKLEVNSGHVVAQLEFASVIGSLMYAMHCTRPDIAFVRTCALQLTYTSYPGVLEGYSNASWINHSGDSKSTSGWIYTLVRGVVSWASKKQTCISHSTMEAEFIALAAVSKESEWISGSINGYPIVAWSNALNSHGHLLAVQNIHKYQIYVVASVYKILGYTSKALELLRFIENGPCKQWVDQYNTIINSLCKYRRVDHAIQLFNDMIQKGVNADVITYSSLWFMFSKKCRAIVIQAMVRKGLHPDVVTYSALIDGYCLRGELSEAHKVLDRMVKSSVLKGSRRTKAQRAYGALRRGADQGAGFMNMSRNKLK
ncbi:retrovirus-related pol polyprotein from transposon TNT 1-94 [Tanacetum coccineum]